DQAKPASEGDVRTPILIPRERTRQGPTDLFTDSIAAHRTRHEPCLVIRPRRTVVSDSWWEGVSPAQQVNWAGPGKRCTSPISATNTAASTAPMPGICWIAV